MNKLHYMLTLNNITVTGKVHPHINVLPSFTHHHLNYIYMLLFFSVEHTSMDYFYDAFR